MMQKELISKSIAEIGAEIGLELGTQLVKNFQVAHPEDAQPYYVGKNIIEKILNQPGCVGIKFYNAINEKGVKTLVYVGIDEQGRSIIEYNTVDQSGQLQVEKGIVADRMPRTFNPGGGDSDDDLQWWEF